MCLFQKAPSPAPPPPLAPTPPPPLPPTPTLPAPDPVIKDVNPQVRRAKKDRGNKAKSEFSQGTGSLRIKLKPNVNTGTDSPSGGVN